MLTTAGAFLLSNQGVEAQIPASGFGRQPCAAKETTSGRPMMK
jgi:hypothetical protein